MEVKYDDYTSSNVWHVGKHFSLTHVLLPLLEARKLIKRAQFGTDNPMEEINMPIHVKNQIRINALRRLHDEIQQMAEDIVFIMDKHNLDLLEKTVIEKVKGISFKGIYSSSYDQRTHTEKININEKEFYETLDILREALQNIKTPQNRKNLIFPAGEDLDLEEMKKDIIDGG